MNKKFLVITTALIMAFSATFAHENNAIPATVVNELHQKFDNANDVQWQTTANFYEAKFNLNGQQLKAFYSFDGQMIGLSRLINVDQLPLALIKDVKEKSATSTVTDLFELLTDRGMEYYITYKNGNQIKTFKSDGQDWVRYAAI